jgi:hypothetical protein
MKPNGVGAAVGLASAVASSVDCFFVSSFMIPSFPSYKPTAKAMPVALRRRQN